MRLSGNELFCQGVPGTERLYATRVPGERMKRMKKRILNKELTEVVA